jgi:hypothetical protein
MFRRMIDRFVRWWLQGKIDYLKRFATHAVVYDADIRRNGHSEDFHYGKAEGIETALAIIFGIEIIREDEQPEEKAKVAK